DQCIQVRGVGHRFIWLPFAVRPLPIQFPYLAGPMKSDFCKWIMLCLRRLVVGRTNVMQHGFMAVIEIPIIRLSPYRFTLSSKGFNEIFDFRFINIDRFVFHPFVEIDGIESGIKMMKWRE